MTQVLIALAMFCRNDAYPNLCNGRITNCMDKCVSDELKRKILNMNQAAEVCELPCELKIIKMKGM